jgi:hypothetical protein
MPVTLRYILPDAGAKLRQLEAGTAALEQDLRNAVPGRQPNSRVIRKLALSALVFLLPKYRVVRSSLASVDRALRSPRLATALRILHAWLSEGIWYLSVALGGLLALALVIALVAPPD